MVHSLTVGKKNKEGNIVAPREKARKRESKEEKSCVSKARKGSQKICMKNITAA